MPFLMFYLLPLRHRKIVDMMAQLQSELSIALGNHISEKNMGLLRNVTSYFGDANTLHRITTDPILAEDFGAIANSLRAMYRL